MTFFEYLLKSKLKAIKENPGLALKLGFALRRISYSPIKTYELRTWLYLMFYTSKDAEQAVIWFKRYKEYLRIRRRKK